MEAILQEKAFEVWHIGMIDERPDYGYSMHDLPVFYGSTPSKAKAQCDIAHDYDIDGREAKFTDLNARRCERMDKMLFEGEVITRNQVEYKLEERKRNAELDQLLADNPNAMAYIMKGGWYYRPNSCGYTERRDRAGVYDLAYAISCVKGCSLRDNMRAIVIDAEEHNKMINAENRMFAFEIGTLIRSVDADTK